jgi:hypothetical protein
MQQPVYLSSPPRLKHTPVHEGGYLRPGDRLDEILPASEVQRLLARGEATTTPPGTPEPRPMPEPLPAWQGQPPDPTPGVKPAWLAADCGVWPDGAGRMYEEHARIDLYAPDRVAGMVESGRATHSKPKQEGRSWRLSTLGGVLPDGTQTAPPVAYGRREIEGVRR